MAEVKVTTESETVVTVQGIFSGAATGEPEALKEAFKEFLGGLRDAVGEENVTGSIVISGESINEQDLFPPEEEAAPAPAPEPATTSTKSSKSSEG